MSSYNEVIPRWWFVKYLVLCQNKLEFLAHSGSNSSANNFDNSNSESGVSSVNRISECALVYHKSVFTNHMVQRKVRFSASDCGNKLVRVYAYT